MSEWYTPPYLGAIDLIAAMPPNALCRREDRRGGEFIEVLPRFDDLAAKARRHVRAYANGREAVSVSIIEPKRHHYVPQFYMRRLACADDPNKVIILERHRDILVADRKSINSIGYEVGLHDFTEEGVAGSIETKLNRTIESPFSDSATWAKIERGDFAALDASDGLSIYGFARHLQRRNVVTLRFMEREYERFREGNAAGLTEDEREMRRWLADTPGGAHRLFREGVLDRSIPADADAINIMVCHAEMPFRSSTNPTLMVSHPGEESIFGEMFRSLRTWWLTLDRHWGVFIVAGGPPGFSNHSVDSAVARVINRRYLVQMLHGDARYLLADDAHLEPDLEWVGFAIEHRTTRGFRYRADSWRDPAEWRTGGSRD